jgi:broad specificity phosphatase PhoE
LQQAADKAGEPVKTYYFVRHGASLADSGELEFEGINAPASADDIPLSDLGREEAARAADFFHRLGVADAVFSSPLGRTYDTAAAIATRLDLPVQLLPEVREVDVSGIFEFFKKRSARDSRFKLGPKDMPFPVYRRMLMATGSALFAAWRVADSIPGTERVDAVRLRLERALNLLDDAPGRHIVVVCHGYFILYLASYLLQHNPLELARMDRVWVPNCSVTKVTARPNGKLRLRYFARDDYDTLLKI